MTTDGPSTVRTGIRAGLPFAIAALLGGASFGVVAKPVIGVVPAIVMSTIVFAGASQFGATAVLAAGGQPLAAILTGLLLNLRFLPMGVAVAGSLRGGAWRRALQGQTLVDASWAVAHRGGGRFDPHILIGATAAQYPAWVLGTAIGAVGASVLDPEATGLDAVFPAFFLALLLTEATASRGGRIAAGLGALIALALTPLLPAGLPILIASAAAVIGARFG